MLLGLDFDGTLANSQTAVENALFWVASKDSEDSINLLKINQEMVTGKTLENQLQSFLKNLSLDQARKMYMDYYRAEGIKKTTFNPGARELLTYCRNNKVQLVVISAKTEENLKLSMNHLGLSIVPSFGGCNQEKKSEYMRKLKVNLYVGDQESDILAAQDASVTSVLYGTKNSFKVEPNFKIQELSELIDVIEQLKHELISPKSP